LFRIFFPQSKHGLKAVLLLQLRGSFQRSLGDFMRMFNVCFTQTKTPINLAVCPNIFASSERIFVCTVVLRIWDVNASGKREETAAETLLIYDAA
jgi:hypothetical protein